ncbi:MAG: sulfatase-like hydrolase/transferase [Chthoniobacteraceae bacterium]
MNAPKLLLAALLLAPLAALTAAGSGTPSKPNFLFILADDLGWGDVGFHHGNVPTPNLDRLAAEGVELTQHYVCPVCSPTRSALLSGRYATRFNITSPQSPRAYRWDTVTLARALKSVGYDTALFGKWHLGSSPEWGPQKFGFDRSYGSLGGGVGPWNHRYKKGEFTNTWHRDGKLVEEEGHVTDLITREAIQWLESRTDKPFLLYVPFTAVHIPIREPEEIISRVPASITERSRRQFGANVMHLDDSVGKILAALEKSGKAANTLVIFGSDNGAIPNVQNADTQYPADDYDPGPAGGSNVPLRGQKGEVYEGGIRTPAVACWPGHLKPGKFTGVAHISDWMPTFCALAGYTPERDLKWDGQNIWPQLTGAEPPKPRTIYTAAPGYRAQALRDGDWKLIVPKASAKKAMKTEAGAPELYDLANDPYETKNLAAAMPEKVAALRAKLAEISKSDGDAVADD